MGKICILTDIFQRGWKHQLEILVNNSMKYLPINWCKISSTVWLDLFCIVKNWPFVQNFCHLSLPSTVFRHGLFFFGSEKYAEFGTSNAKQQKKWPEIMYRKNGIVSGDVLLCTMVKHHQTTQASYATPRKWGSKTGSRNFGRSTMGVAYNHAIEVRNITKFLMTCLRVTTARKTKHVASERQTSIKRSLRTWKIYHF